MLQKGILKSLPDSIFHGGNLINFGAQLITFRAQN